MGITRSINKHNGVCYAYETTYEWDEAKQKKVQKKRCIGQFVPGTNEIIPNGPRGKKTQGGTPVIKQIVPDETTSPKYANTISEINEIRSKLKVFEESLADLSIATRELADNLASLANKEKS